MFVHVLELSCAQRNFLNFRFSTYEISPKFRCLITEVSCVCSNFRVAQRIFFEITAEKSHFFARNFGDISSEQYPNFDEIRLHSFCTVLYDNKLYNLNSNSNFLS